MYKILITLSVALVVISSVSGGPTGGKHAKGGKHMHNMTCKGEPLNMKALFAGGKECHDEIFGTSTSTAKPMDAEAKKEMMKKWKDNAVCMEVCALKKQKTLNSDGTYNAAEADKHIKAVFPTAVQAPLKKALDECAAANSKSFSMDNKCEGYKAFRDCNHKKVMEICEIKMGEHKQHSSEESD